MNHVMFDVESLGTVADSCIMSIGAVKFDLGSERLDDTAFYASVSIDSNLELKRRIQEDTLIFWMNQGEDAKGVFNEAKQTLKNALEDLITWIGEGEFQVWSNGADFDLPMLAHAFTQCGLTIPWEYWNSNCFRTYKKLPGAKNVKPEFAGIKHNAMFDAVHQAKHAQAIYAKLFAGKHVLQVAR